MNSEKIKQIIGELDSLTRKTGKVCLMEVCGTHTVSIMRSGIKQMLPEKIKLISGPGCPVCVTPQSYVDTACKMSKIKDVIICTYGDMIRVPGSSLSLEKCKADGAEVLIVYSARDAVATAQKNPTKKIVFLGVGFETTTPATALAVMQAGHQGVKNFYIYSAHKLVIPAMKILLSSGDIKIDGFLCPGHVSIVLGADAYKPIAEEYGKSCVIAGFEPMQILEGVLKLVRQLAEQRAAVENVYTAAVSSKGSEPALKAINDVFDVADTTWRAMGVLPGSGLVLNSKFKQFDAVEQLGITEEPEKPIKGCLCGDVIQGKLDPPQCPLFGKVCTPYEPIGPCMVSSEGTCSAWYKYRPGNIESKTGI